MTRFRQEPREPDTFDIGSPPWWAPDWRTRLNPIVGALAILVISAGMWILTWEAPVEDSTWAQAQDLRQEVELVQEVYRTGLFGHQVVNVVGTNETGVTVTERMLLRDGQITRHLGIVVQDSRRPRRIIRTFALVLAGLAVLSLLLRRMSSRGQ